MFQVLQLPIPGQAYKWIDFRNCPHATTYDGRFADVKTFLASVQAGTPDIFEMTRVTVAALDAYAIGPSKELMKAVLESIGIKGMDAVVTDAP